MLTISKTFTFEASHILPRHPGKCSRLHGHSWVLTVEVEGEVDPESGFVMDYGDLKRIVEANIINLVDHQHLGQGSVLLGVEEDHQATVFGVDFYPSSENLVNIFVVLLMVPFGPKLYSITLNETCTSAAKWQRKD